MLKDGEKGVILQRDKQTYAVAPHIPCGITTPDMLRKIADTADKFGGKAMKITSAARIAIIGLEENVIDDAWKFLGMEKGGTTGLCIRSVKVCPGTTYCKRGILDSLSIGMKLDELYHNLQLPGKMKIGVSGCPNQCAETCIKDIGLVGFVNGWKILVGGKGGAMPRLSEELSKNLDEEQALEMIAKIIKYFKENAKPHQRMGIMIDRMGGIEEFKKELNL